MKKKFLSAMLAGTIIMTNSVSVFATENAKNLQNNTNEVEVSLNSEKEEKTKSNTTKKSEKKQTKKKTMDQATHEQLIYAIDEMKEAITLLDTADFTNQSRYDRMIAFSTASLDRVRGFDESKITAEMKPHIEWIEESGDEIRNATYRINRVLHAINNVKTVFSPDRKDTIENKKIVLKSLDQVIKEEKEASILNQKTLDSSSDILKKYSEKLKEEIENSQADEALLKELTYAVEEMRIAKDLFETADFTNKDNYDRMIIFATTSLDRSRALNIKEDHKWYGHIKWIEATGDRIRNATNSIDRLLVAIDNVKTVFNPDRKDTVDNMKIVLNILNDVINQEEAAGHLNKVTIESAKKILKDYWFNMPASPDGEVPDMGVDPEKPDTGVKPEQPEEPSNPDEEKPDTGVKPEQPEKPSNPNEEKPSTNKPTKPSNNATTIKGPLPKTGFQNGLLSLGIISTLSGAFLTFKKRK